jgi:hypothetical protein
LYKVQNLILLIPIHSSLSTDVRAFSKGVGICFLLASAGWWMVEGWERKSRQEVKTEVGD